MSPKIEVNITAVAIYLAMSISHFPNSFLMETKVCKKVDRPYVHSFYFMEM